MFLFVGVQSTLLNMDVAVTVGWKEIGILCVSAWLAGCSWTFVDLLLEDVQCETYCVSYSPSGWSGEWV